MQLATQTLASVPTPNFAADERNAGAESQFADYKIIRRNGSVVGFEPAKISVAMTKAFLAVNGGTGAASARVREQVALLIALDQLGVGWNAAELHEIPHAMLGDELF